MQKILPKKYLNGLLKNWLAKYELIAPIKEKNTKFERIDLKNIDKLYLKDVTEVPAKKHFIPENEILLYFKNGKTIENKGTIKKTIIFGLRKCDLNAIQILDKVMYDIQYINKRKNTILVGLFCENPDKYCFCNSMDLNDYFDLFFYPKRKNYIISIGSKKGEKLVKNLPDLKKEIKIPNPKNYKTLRNKKIESDYNNALWKNDSEKCLSCSACTIYCPTCNCFDIKDNLDLNLKDGTRTRHSISCQLKSFSRVAGGKSFRDSRLSRFKHFVYHKIVYYKKQKDRYMCVGCGRCLRVCPTKIDWVETINKIKK